MDHIFDGLGIVCINGVAALDDDKTNSGCIHFLEVDSCIAWMLVITNIHTVDATSWSQGIYLGGSSYGRCHIADQG